MSLTCKMQYKLSVTTKYLLELFDKIGTGTRNSSNDFCKELK